MNKKKHLVFELFFVEREKNFAEHKTKHFVDNFFVIVELEFLKSVANLSTEFLFEKIVEKVELIEIAIALLLQCPQYLAENNLHYKN